MILSGSLAIIRPEKRTLFAIIGGIIYAISWGILSLGVYLARTEGVILAKSLINKVFKKNKTLKQE